VTVEVDDPSIDPQTAALTWFRPEKIDKKDADFQKAFAHVKPLMETVIEALEGLGRKQYQVEFGLKMAGKLGAVVVSGEAETNFKITVAWGQETARNE
jgi:hypothetical protein